MDIYLTDEELEREADLFAPNETQYKELTGTACDIRAFVEQVSEDDDILPTPPSC